MVNGDIAYSDALPTLAWLFWGAAIWWTGRSTQFRDWYEGSTLLRPAPPWLLWLCGLRGHTSAVHLPIAALQIVGLLSSLASPFIVVSFPPESERSRAILVAILVAPGTAAGLTALAVWMARALGRGR